MQKPFIAQNTSDSVSQQAPAAPVFQPEIAPVDASPRRSSPPLSPTEHRVYDLLLQHLTERQVAERMNRSHNTVHVHVRNIYRKLGVRSRQELFQLPYQATKRSI